MYSPCPVLYICWSPNVNAPRSCTGIYCACTGTRSRMVTTVRASVYAVRAQTSISCRFVHRYHPNVHESDAEPCTHGCAPVRKRMSTVRERVLYPNCLSAHGGGPGVSCLVRRYAPRVRERARPCVNGPARA